MKNKTLWVEDRFRYGRRYHKKGKKLKIYEKNQAKDYFITGGFVIRTKEINLKSHKEILEKEFYIRKDLAYITNKQS